jgi:antitoxin VapB
MALDFKDDEVEQLASKLSELTGENITAAVTEAIRERLNRLPCAQDSGLAERLLRIGRKCAASLREPNRSGDHGDILFDERGLPQ